MARKTRWGTIIVVCVLGALLAVGSVQGWFSGTGTSSSAQVEASSTPVATEPSRPASGRGPGTTAAPAGDPIRELFDQRRSGIEVQGTGVVSRILADDDDGSRHQKFLLTTPGGVSILIAHNIDIAPRLDGLAKGDRIEFHGDYEWSEKGGTVHWTHHDPSGRHEDGWLRWNGRTFS